MSNQQTASDELEHATYMWRTERNGEHARRVLEKLLRDHPGSIEAEAASNLLDEIGDVAASGGEKETHIDAPGLILNFVKLLPFVIGAGVLVPILLLVVGPLALIYILPAAGLFVLFSIFALWPSSKRPKHKASATGVAISAVIFIILIVLRLSELS